MNIIILGNDFDLAHGLPTRYTDFLKYCRDYDSKLRPISDDKDIEREFYENINDNVWLSYFLEITPDIDEYKTWIDFETEILGVIKGICPGERLGNRKAFDSPKQWETLTREEFENSQYALFHDYLAFEDKDGKDTSAIGYNPAPPVIDIEGLYVKLRKFTRAFEMYCCLIINYKCGIKKRFRLNTALLSTHGAQESQNKTYIVSFNYTRIFSRFYDTGADKAISYSYVYPHGEAHIGETLEPAYDGLVTSGLVLGTRSFDRTENDINYDIPVEFNVFQKHNQQHRYSTLADFQHLLLRLRASASSDDSESVNIFIIGHSLDESDHAKLKHLFAENKNAKITVFYHDEASFQRYINNITGILGESDVAVRVRFYHQNNQTSGLLLPYWVFENGKVSSEIIDTDEEGLAVEDKISEILTDYFLSNNSLDELSTHTLSTQIVVESVSADTIDSIELKEENSVVVKGSGYIEAELQIGDNNDFRQGDGVISYKSFPLSFNLLLTFENTGGRSEDEKFTLADIDFKIDTSSFDDVYLAH